MASTDQATLHVRFDIDTITCVRSGLPWLMKYADRYGVRFTFFVNMGKAISHAAVLGRKVSSEPRRHQGKAAHLSPLEKLGLRDYLITACFNPPVGAVAPGLLLQLLEQGHDIGLHGGCNHGAWQYGALNWSKSRLEEEVQWGIMAMENAGLPSPEMFASPGFASPPHLPAILKENGFSILADRHEFGMPLELGVADNGDELVQVNTGLAGEPGGVGYFEYLFASGVRPADIGRHIRPFVDRGSFICYDHPAFVSERGKNLFRAALDFWLDNGGVIVPLSDSPLFKRKTK